MKRARHHWHVIVDEHNKATPGVIEHEHQVNPGRRHYHGHAAAELLAAFLEGGLPEPEARLKAFRLDGTPATTLDLDQEPRPTMDEPGVIRELHPEVRRSLS